MKTRRLQVVIGVSAVLIAAFLLLSFRAAVSNTQAQYNTVTTTSGDRLPDAIQRREKISLVVLGEGPLVKALQKSLPAEIRKAGLGEIELAPALQTRYQNPVLVVEVGSPGLTWLPVYAAGQFTIQASYASNGDTTFMGDTPITYEIKDGPALNMSADFKINDRSWGLISRPGYHQFLADSLAQQIVAALKTLYKVNSG